MDSTFPGTASSIGSKPMKTLLMLLLSATVFVPVVAAQSGQGEEVTLLGTLQGGRVAIGGETTGWTLDYRDESGSYSIEVELPPSLLPQVRSGAAVRLTGVFVSKSYVERGAVRIFRVTRVEAQSAPAANPQAGGPARLPQLTREQLNPRQRALADEILKVSSVGLGGPYNSMLRSPEMGERLFRLIDYLRFNSSVPRRLNEFAILIQARLWTSQVEWLAHYPLAIKEGVSEATAADLKAGRRPRSMKPDEAVVYDICTEISTTRAVSDATYQRAA